MAPTWNVQKVSWKKASSWAYFASKRSWFIFTIKIKTGLFITATMKILTFSIFLIMSLTVNSLPTKTMEESVEAPKSSEKTMALLRSAALEISRICSKRRKISCSSCQKNSRILKHIKPRMKINGRENNIRLNGTSNYRLARLELLWTRCNQFLRSIVRPWLFYQILRRWKGTQNKSTKSGLSWKCQGTRSRDRR